MSCIYREVSSFQEPLHCGHFGDLQKCLYREVPSFHGQIYIKKACLQSVLNTEVSLFQGQIESVYLGHNTGVSLFQGCPLREAPLYVCSIGKKTYFILLCISIVSLHSNCDISKLP